MVTIVDTFLEELASAAPVPGGGSVAALQTAMGAALLAMVAGLTVGRKRYEAVQERAEHIRAEARALMLAARRTAEEDAEAYSTVAAALALPRQSDSERSERQQRVQEGLKGAVKPPIDTMRLAARVAHLAGELADIGNRSAISDVGTALLAAVAGYHAARLNVETNLASIRDEGWVARTRESMRDLPDPASLQTAIMQRIEAVIRGEAE